MLIETPDLQDAQRLLCVQPHYDDNDIGAGGTIASLARAGAQVAYVTVTDDQLGSPDPGVSRQTLQAQLRSEQARAADELGVVRQFWLDYPDAGPYDVYALRREIVRHLRLWRPDFVLTPDPWLPYEAHGDHIHVGRATAEACLLFGLPRFESGDPELDASFSPYALQGVAFYFTAEPNAFIDISETRASKHRAISAYQTQLAGEALAAVHAALEAKERQWAEHCAGTFAEAFKVLAPEHLHCNPDADQMFRRV